MAIRLQGVVQGVGFRPFVYRLAQALSLTGWVNNSSQGVTIEAEGDTGVLRQFVTQLQNNLPPHAQIKQLEWQWTDLQGDADFTIHHSDAAGAKTAHLLPDLAICDDCLSEIFDPTNRRYHYPFTNCTHCGSRFSIIQALPYDRANTTMHSFTMCAACQAEYDALDDRRFHAQPNACPDCGPQLALWDYAGEVLAQRETALQKAIVALQEGQIVAVKNTGGFLLLCAAYDEALVQKLRQRKRRPHKPFAVLFPSLRAVQQFCEVNATEAAVLQSAAAPIVLLRRKSIGNLAPSVAPDNPYLGAMLPNTPLQALLMAEVNFPVVATSGNVSDEPICIDEYDALARLNHIADIFLVHDRPIARPVDDSVVQVIHDTVQILRCARGYAPQTLTLSEKMPVTLAVGAQMKNTIAYAAGQQMCLSQHIGDLQSPQTYEVFCRTIQDFACFYDWHPEHLVHDLHPDTLSTQYAQKRAVPQHPVQHHIAHVLSGMVDNGLFNRVLGVAWDGTGYGLDQTIWGGEWLYVTEQDIERVAYLRPFPLPGGESALREPRRSALGVLYAVYGDALFEMSLPTVQAFPEQEQHILKTMLQKKFNTPLTSSMGRLFDAVASLLDLCQISTFEGHAAMAVEAAALATNAPLQRGIPTPNPGQPLQGADAFHRDIPTPNLEQPSQGADPFYGDIPTPNPGQPLQGADAFHRDIPTPNLEQPSQGADPFYGDIPTPNPRQPSQGADPFHRDIPTPNLEQPSQGADPFYGDSYPFEFVPPEINWHPMIRAIVADIYAGYSAPIIATKFHHTLAEMILAVAQHVGEESVLLTGGCFQNRFLSELVITQLKQDGFIPYWHQRIPPNDGGIAIGQIAAFFHQVTGRRPVCV